MPVHMFQEVVSSRGRTSRKWYTLPLSFVIHTSVLGVLVVVPLLATDVLPTPRSVLEFVIMPAAPSLPAAPPQRIERAAPAPMTQSAPLVAPESIGVESGLVHEYDTVPARGLDGSVVAGAGAYAAASGSQPYFVSIKVDEAFMREGPSDMHRVKWIYRRKGLPLEVIATFDVWRRVRDMDGEVGWMHMALLTRDRTAVVTTGPGAELYARDDTTSQLLAHAQAGAIGRLLGCSMLACEVEFPGAEGWIARARLWGVHGGEEY